MPDARSRYIAAAIQLVLVGAVTYYGVKWIVDAMDPAKKSRLKAQQQAGDAIESDFSSYEMD